MLERINQARPGRPELGSPIWWEQNIPLIKFDSFKPAELVARSEASLETKTGKGRLRVLDSAKAGLRRLHNWLLEECGPSIDGEFTAQKTPATPEVQSIQVLTTSDESPIIQTTPEPPANNKLENLKAAVDERKKTINMIKAGLSQVYAGQDRLIVGGKDIFASARRQRKKYPEKPEKFADSISRALLKVAKNKDWVATFPIVTQRVLFKLQAEQEVLRKDSKALSREKSKQKKLDRSLVQNNANEVLLEPPLAAVVSRKKEHSEASGRIPRLVALRTAAVFGVGVSILAVLMFIKGAPEIPLAFSSNTNPVVKEAGITTLEGFVPQAEYDRLQVQFEEYKEKFREEYEGALRLQRSVLELKEKNDRYRKELDKLPSSPLVPVLEYRVDNLQRQNRELKKENQELQQQLAAAKAGPTTPQDPAEALFRPPRRLPDIPTTVVASPPDFKDLNITIPEGGTFWGSVKGFPEGWVNPNNGKSQLEVIRGMLAKYAVANGRDIDHLAPGDYRLQELVRLNVEQRSKIQRVLDTNNADEYFALVAQEAV